MTRESIFFVVVLTLVLCYLAVVGMAAEDDILADAPALTPDTQAVERIRAAVSAEVSRQLAARPTSGETEAHDRLVAKNKELIRRQQELAYQDPIASGIRQKLIAAQKQVMDLRRSLQARLEAIEEIQDLEAQRREIMEQLQELRTKTRAEEGETGDR